MYINVLKRYIANFGACRPVKILSAAAIPIIHAHPALTPDLLYFVVAIALRVGDFLVFTAVISRKG